MYKLFLPARYLRSRRIVYFAIAAVTLCTMMVLIVMSVMGGFLETVRQRARGMLGDVVIDNRTWSGFPLYEEFIQRVQQWPEVVRATPVIYSYGLLRFPSTGQDGAIRVVGVRFQEICEVNQFRSGLYYERYYPGLTHLGPQQQPLMGFDVEAEPIRESDGREIAPPLLPPAYMTALAKARDDARARGADLADRDSVENGLNEMLARHGRATLPGFYKIHPDELTPGMSGDELPGLIIGRDLIAKREADGRYDRYYPRGSIAQLSIVPVSLSANIDSPVKQAFRYVDDSRTGIYDIDSQHVYGDFDLLQKLLQMDAADRVDADGNVIGRAPPRCSQIQIKLRPDADAAALCRRFAELYQQLGADEQFDLTPRERQLIGFVEALTWEQSQAHVIAPIEKERVLVTLLFGIISLVAVALVLCILYMIVLQKTRDIGIIKSVGGSATGVALVFVIYGAAVGIVGGLLGTLAGTLFVTNINEIQDLLIRFNPRFRVWDLSVYSFDRIPQQVAPLDAAKVFLIAVLASTLGSLAAAWRAGSMQPVEALRYE